LADILPQGFEGRMRLHGLGNVSTIAALLAGLASGASIDALAQDTAAAGANTGTAGVKAEIDVKAQAALSSEEQLAQANSIVRRGNQLAERLSRMLNEARREKDILRANCVNRKLTEVNANVRNVDQRAKALRDAAQGGDESRRNHEFTVLTVLSAKLDTLNHEAAQCLGESVFEPGASQVVTTVPANAPTLDPTSVSPSTAPPPPSSTVPPPTSPVSPTN
jgi:hypothetical protein